MPGNWPPTLEQSSQRLAQNNRRVARALDQLPTIVKQMVEAFFRHDQRTLSDLSQKLSQVAANQESVAAIAGELERQIDLGQHRQSQRSLLALIGEIGALSRRGIVPAVALPADRGAGI